MSHQVGFALSSQWALQRIALHSNAQSGAALVHSEGHWPGRQHPPGFTVAAVGLCRLVHFCVVSGHRDFKIRVLGEGWLKPVPELAPFFLQHLMLIYRILVLFFKMNGLLLTDESGSLFLHQRIFCYVGLSAVGGSASKGRLSLFLWTVQNNFTWACWIYIPFFSCPILTEVYGKKCDA